MDGELVTKLKTGATTHSTNIGGQENVEDLESGDVRNGGVSEEGLKTRARRAFGAARGVVSVVRACSSRIASRCRHRTRGTPAGTCTPSTKQPLSAMSLAQLDALRANLEAEEAGLMEKLRELWQHLSAGSHLQPAFVDPDRLAHVTRLLLAGDTEAVERDPDNEEISGAATMQLTSQRLEAALVEVHTRMQAVCEARRRRKALNIITSAAQPATALSAPNTPRRKEAPSVTPAVTPSVKRTLTSASSRRAGEAPAVNATAGVGERGTRARINRIRGCEDETPKRKLSATSLADAFVEGDGTPWYHRAREEQGVGSPRPKPVPRWRARLNRRSAAEAEQMCPWPAEDGDEAHGFCVVELGYTKLPTHD